MAKNSTPSPFRLDTGLAVPIAARGGGKTAIPYPFAQMKPGISFLVDVAIPESITDEAERLKAFKEEARKVANRISGSVRRHRKTPGSEKQTFAIRVVNDGTLGKGVRVWREKDAA